MSNLQKVNKVVDKAQSESEAIQFWFSKTKNYGAAQKAALFYWLLAGKRVV